MRGDVNAHDAKSQDDCASSAMSRKCRPCEGSVSNAVAFENGGGAAGSRLGRWPGGDGGATAFALAVVIPAFIPLLTAVFVIIPMLKAANRDKLVVRD
jgi:hypothetical protein